MRVLHVIPSYYPATAYGGPIESTRILIRSLRDLGVFVTVLTTDADGSETIHTTDTEQVIDGTSVIYCHRLAGDAVAPRLATLVPSLAARVDVVHLTGVYSFPTFPTLIACDFLRRPVVWSPRGSFQSWSAMRRRLLKRLWRSAARPFARRVTFHATSDRESDQVRQAYNGATVRVVPNAVESTRVSRAPRTGFTALYLGRLHPIKRLENLIDAVAFCPSEFNLVIAGWGEASYATSLQQRVRAQGVEARVTFSGYICPEGRATLFGGCDVVVLPSESENFGMSVAEALASGVPVLVSPNTPWADVEQVGCGLVSECDPQSLATALCRLADEDLSAMGARGAAWATAQFGPAVVAQKMLSLYEAASAR